MINVAEKLASLPSYVVGLIQAVSIATYILLFVTAAINAGPLIGASVEDTFAGPAVFLIAFITSALICGTIMLGYPTWLTVQSRFKEAIVVILYSIGWLLAILLAIICIALIVNS